ncbi:MAG: extracellular solute-binding protein [Lentisphaeria bacterium]|nr:extracellular solute-binding protein [Lentisphaeria bacterium]
MKQDKLTIVRNWILDLLESGEVPAGEKLPVTRDIAAATGISLLIVQSAVESLSNEGVLYKVPRHGVYVHPDWSSRILQRNVFFFDPLYELPYRSDLIGRLQKEFPLLRVVKGFRHGMFELRTTGYLQSHHAEYADLSEIFRSVFPDDSDFTNAPFEACRMNGRLVGLPLIFSPRVMFCNTALLERAGVPEPAAGWTWNDFRKALAAFRPLLPPEKRYYWKGEPFIWMNYLRRAGGTLIDPAASDPVRIDTPETRRGLEAIRQLLRENEIPFVPALPNYWERFIDGELPFLEQPREFLPLLDRNGCRNWRTAPLPAFPGGNDTTVQATDILCVRRECADMHTAAGLVRLLLGESFQNYIAELRYGIPIRLSAMQRSLDPNDAGDRLFLSEIPKMTTNYHLSDSTLYKLVVTGINRILAGEADIEEGTAELAAMTRTFLKLRPPVVHAPFPAVSAGSAVFR